MNACRVGVSEGEGAVVQLSLHVETSPCKDSHFALTN